MTQPPLLAVMQGGDYCARPICSHLLYPALTSFPARVESSVLNSLIRTTCLWTGGNVRHVVLGIAALMLVCAFSTDSSAFQATGQIGGTVRDQSGAVLPG